MSFQSSQADTAKQSIESCIEDIRQWMAVNFLKLNDDKTELLVINSCYQKPENETLIKIGSDKITSSSYARNIGVIFDDTMSMKKQVNAIIQQCFRQLRNLGLIRKYLDKKSTEIFVHAFVTSRLDYCNSLLWGLPQSLIKKLQHVQNTAARIVTMSKKRDHITPVLKSLHWLPIQQRIRFKIILITYKALNGLAPEYITELLQDYKQERTLRSRNQQLLHTPAYNTRTYGSRAFKNAAPELWNALPVEIRSATTVDIFKNLLKTHIYREIYK
jgi:hypothetical protein